MKKIVIELTDQQFEKMMTHFKRENEINEKEETFSGYSFTLICTECGVFDHLEVEVNTKLKLGDVNWHYE